MRFPLPASVRSRLLPRVLPLPVHVRHAEYSLLMSLDDDRAVPSPRLLDVALRAAERARQIDLSPLAARKPETAQWLNVWPGEHYRLLAALVENEKPRLVVEIGTAQGLSARVIQHALPPGGKIITYDILSWKAFPDAHLIDEDFDDGRLEQRLIDLADPQVCAREATLLRTADIIFIDAAKDGSLEQRFLDNLATIRFERPPLVVFDDIRLWNMLAIWRGVTRPKLDITSFGHWSGTGFIDWVP
jgi:predicted O-methyltransferase YrrM